MEMGRRGEEGSKWEGEREGGREREREREGGRETERERERERRTHILGYTRAL